MGSLRMDHWTVLVRKSAWYWLAYHQSVGWNLLQVNDKHESCHVSIPSPKNTVELGTKSVTYSPKLKKKSLLGRVAKARQFSLKTIKVSCETSMMPITPQHFTHLTEIPGCAKKCSNQPHSLPTATFGWPEAEAKHHRLNLPEIPIESLPREIQPTHTRHPSHRNPTGVVGFGNRFQPLLFCNWATPMKTEFVMITNAKNASNCQASTCWTKKMRKTYQAF